MKNQVILVALRGLFLLTVVGEDYCLQSFELTKATIAVGISFTVSVLILGAFLITESRQQLPEDEW